MSYLEELSDRFARAWRGLGDVTPTAPVFERMVAAYSEPHRRYHTLEHVTHCLAWLERLWTVAEHPHEVALAIWYHDFVYDPLRPDNEARSAQVARDDLTQAGVAREVIERVAALVMATSTHSATHGDAALLVDIDLTILGADAESFARFEQQVREEYAAFDDRAYAQGRARVLEKLLTREPQYVTPLLAAQLGDRARANLAHAVKRWKELSGFGVS